MFNMGQMQVFRRRNETNDIVNAIPELPNDISDSESSEHDYITAVLGSNEIDEDEDVIGSYEPRVNEEYRGRCISTMVRDADVHYHSIQFNPGGCMLIKRSFDNANRESRKRKMEERKCK